MYRYAIFHNPSRARKWRVVSQSRLVFIWIEFSHYDYDTEEEALNDWRRSVKREKDRRVTKHGEQRTAWEPK